VEEMPHTMSPMIGYTWEVKVTTISKHPVIIRLGVLGVIMELEIAEIRMKLILKTGFHVHPRTTRRSALPVMRLLAMVL
jgi:hypothetical protein